MTAKARRRKRSQPELIRTAGFPDDHTQLNVISLTAEERLSAPFVIHLELEPDDPQSFNAETFEEAVSGQPISVSVRPSRSRAESERHFHGEVASVSIDYSAETGSMPRIVVELRPLLSRLGRSEDTRLFTDRTTQEIVSEVLDDYGLAEHCVWHSSASGGTPNRREHRWQYRESDLTFVERLLEEDGWIYWFTFENDRHVLHFADVPQPLPVLDGSPLKIGGIGRGRTKSGQIAHLRRITTAAPGSSVVHGRSLDGESTLSARAVSNGVETGVIHHPDGKASTQSACRALAERQLARHRSVHRTVDGRSDIRSFSAGCMISVASPGSTSPSRYRLTAVLHEATQSTAEYTNIFEGVPDDAPLPTMPHHSRPAMASTIATVAEGPDSSGHYRLRFDLDRRRGLSAPVPLGRDADTITFPRVGDRVQVGFTESDPDRPTIQRTIDPPDSLPFDPSEHPRLGGFFTEAHQMRIDSNPSDPSVTLRVAGLIDDAVHGDRLVETGRDCSETVLRDADCTIHRNASWSVLGSTVHRSAKNHVIEARTVDISAEKRIVLRAGSSFLMIDATGGVTAVGKPLLHLNPPGRSAPPSPAARKKRKKRARKPPASRKPKTT